MRGKPAKKRVIKPDIMHQNVMLSKLINKVMLNGKKSVARSIVYGALDIIKNEKKLDPINTFELAMRNVMPEIEVRTRRIGGANYQVPVPVSERRQEALGLKWILDAARSKKGQPMMKKLANELVDASNNTGTSVKKREDVHKMAEANKSFSHFR